MDYDKTQDEKMNFLNIEELKNEQPWNGYFEHQEEQKLSINLSIKSKMKKRIETKQKKQSS